MNDLQIFNNDEFGEIRTVVIEGEPWFVGKDVAEALGYVDPNKAIAMHVDSEDKLYDNSSSSLGQRGGWLISESGLYNLVFCSRLAEAKRFKRWVTSEVLPSIRKTGGYHLPQTLSEALQMAADQAKQIEMLEAKNKELEPKGIFFDTVTQSDATTSMADVAKILDMGVGRNKLFSILKNRKILQPDNKPYQKYIDAGYFKLVEEKYDKGDGVGIYYKTVAKQKGIDFIRKILLEELT